MWPSSIHKKHWEKWVCELSTGCHLWIASTRSGRPRVWCGDNYKFFNPVRLICTESYGPSELDACHVPPCKNYLCINPDHLYWGDSRTNELDKGRGIAPCISRAGSKFRVKISWNNHIGVYSSLEEAVAARDKYLEQL